MGFDGLAVFVLQQVGERPLERAGRATGEGRRVPTGLDAVAGRLVADQPHAGIVDERVEDADRIRSAADAGGHRVGQPARLVEHLRAGLQPDHPLEVTHHHRERVRSGRGAEAVVGVVGVGDPVAERLVDGVLQGLGPRLDRHHAGAQQPHPRDVERLARGVDRTHVDDALEPEQRTRGGRRHAVLAGAGLGDDAGLAHLPGQQGLTENVVDLVRPGVVEVFSLEEDPGVAGVLTQPLGLVQR